MRTVLTLVLLLAAAAARAADCVAPGSLPALLDETEAMSPAQRRGLDLAAFLTAATYRYACAGLAGAGASACAELAGRDLRVPGARALDWNCRQRMDEATFARALARRDPEAAGACARILTDQLGVPSARRAKALCAELVAGGPESDARLCRAICAASGREPTELRLRGCRGALKIYRGEGLDCAALAKEDYLAADLPLCRAARALRAGDCAGDPLCRAMSGAGPAACAAFEDEAKAVFAARRAAVAPAAPGPQGAPKLSLADDVLPRVPESEPAASTSAPAGDGRVTAARRDAYPVFAAGELRLPALYAPGKDYAAADLPALTAALRAAHHLADVNVASQEGYRRAPALDAGAERALTKDAPAAGEPAVLRFVVDPRGRWQLVRLGFTLDPKAAPGPRGPFVAVNLYDRAGLYAPEFPDAAALAASGARTFYGATPPAPRARRPLCPAAPAPAGRVVE